MKKQTKEICYNLINSLLAGLLVFLGAFTTGKIDTETFFIAFVASAIVFITKFKDYFDGEAGEYSNKLFNFIK